MSWILTLLSGWQTKVMALLSGALLIAIGIIKYKSSKLDKVEHELKTVTKKAEITEIQSKQKKTALEDEQKTIEELISDVEKSRDDRNANL
jgi:hypothetical protein